MLKELSYKKDIFYLMNKYSMLISRIETEMLLEYLFNCAKLDLYVRDFIVNETVEELYDSLINRRLEGEPIQYITGRAEFMGLDFIVTKDTLIPRPETEILVNEVEVLGEGFPRRSLSRTKPKGSGQARVKGQGKILDLFTGCGNIAISLAKLMPEFEIVATDISEAALKIAEKNAVRHNLSGRIKFYKGNLFNALIFATFARHRNNGGLSINAGIKQDYVVKNSKFDIITCNPPYIKEGDLSYLQKEIKFEPEIALNGGGDGLDFYRIIAKESHKYLKENGSILLEIGFGQKQAVEDIFLAYNIFETCKIVKDFNGIQRVMWFNLI